MIRFAPGVRVAYFQSAILEILQAASVWSLLADVDVEILALHDGTDVHLATSLHGYDLAVDLTTIDKADSYLASLHLYLWRVLPAKYEAIVEGGHVHVEFDARRRPRGASR